MLKDFLKGEGYDPHQAGLRNLAGTARLNLILKQNAAMANAAAEWKRMHDPDAMRVFPYVRYHARNDGRTRSAHGDLDGKIFRKDDPFLTTHTPPWEFNCRCYLEEITAKEAGRHSDMVQEPPPADKVTVDSESGFQFNPEHAFEKFDLSGIKNSDTRHSTHNDFVEYCKKEKIHVSLTAKTEILNTQTIQEPSNLEEIKRVITQVNDKLDAGVTPDRIADKKISLGKLLPEHRLAGIGDDELNIVFHTQGGQDHGTKHWIKNHRDTLRLQKFLELMRKTIWNSAAKCIEDINGAIRRLIFEYSDAKGNVITSVFELGDSSSKEWSLIDSWEPDNRYLIAQEKKRQKRKAADGVEPSPPESGNANR